MQYSGTCQSLTYVKLRHVTLEVKYPSIVVEPTCAQTINKLWLESTTTDYQQFYIILVPWFVYTVLYIVQWFVQIVRSGTATMKKVL